MSGSAGSGSASGSGRAADMEEEEEEEDMVETGGYSEVAECVDDMSAERDERVDLTSSTAYTAAMCSLLCIESVTSNPLHQVILLYVLTKHSSLQFLYILQQLHNYIFVLNICNQHSGNKGSAADVCMVSGGELPVKMTFLEPIPEPCLYQIVCVLFTENITAYTHIGHERISQNTLSSLACVCMVCALCVSASVYGVCFVCVCICVCMCFDRRLSCKTRPLVELVFSSLFHHSTLKITKETVLLSER